MAGYYGQGYFHEINGAEHRSAIHSHDLDVRCRPKHEQSALLRPLVLLAITVIVVLTVLWFDSVTASASSFDMQESLTTIDSSMLIDYRVRTDQERMFEHQDKLSSADRTVLVRSGDSLWSIAREYVPAHQDIRDYIVQIRHVNRLDNSMVYEGMLLVIP